MNLAIKKKKEKEKEKGDWFLDNLCKYYLFGYKIYSFRRPLRFVVITCFERDYSLNYPFKPRIKSHLLFAGIIRSSPFSPR
jgi:hypothetical protein